MICRDEEVDKNLRKWQKFMHIHIKFYFLSSKLLEMNCHADVNGQRWYRIVIGAQSVSHNVKDLFQLDKFLCYNVFIGKLLLLSMFSRVLCIVMLYGPFGKAKIVAWFMVCPLRGRFWNFFEVNYFF